VVVDGVGVCVVVGVDDEFDGIDVPVLVKVAEPALVIGVSVAVDVGAGSGLTVVLLV
jgi:hypothetical protein